MKTKPLENKRHERFCQIYVIDRNATKAAERSGYSQRSAYSIGFGLLKKYEIQRRIYDLEQEIAKRNDLSVDRIVEESKRLAWVDPRQCVDESGELIPIQDLPEDVARALSGFDRIERTDRNGDTVVTYKYRFWDKNKAQEHLYRNQGGFRDRIEIDVKTSIDVLLQVVCEVVQPEQADVIRERVEARISQLRGGVNEIEER